MGQKSLIEWTDHTFNPWWGCVAVSPACDHCYAETFAKRVGFSETGSQFPIWGKDTQRRFFSDAHWGEPLKWNAAALKRGKSQRVFCGSMCDVMEEHPDLAEPRRRLFEVIDNTPWLEWMLLTKRPQNFQRFLPKDWVQQPRTNIRLMTTVESEEFLWRAETLIQQPCAKRGLSIEPLLGPLDLSAYRPVAVGKDERIDLLRGEIYHGREKVADCPRIDWLIVGTESGARPRETEDAWIHSLIDQCRAAKVACFVKQRTRKGRKIAFEEWPTGLQVREFPSECADADR